jgi:hypothetical protein
VKTWWRPGENLVKFRNSVNIQKPGENLVETW